MAKGKDSDRTPMFGVPDVYVRNTTRTSTQPKLDAYRKEAQAGFVRHPPKTTKTVEKYTSNDPNKVGNKNLHAQQEIAAEQSSDDVDGM